MQQQSYFSLSQVRQLTGVNPRTLRRDIATGHLTVIATPLMLLVSQAELDRYVAERLPEIEATRAVSIGQRNRMKAEARRLADGGSTEREVK